MLYSNLRILQHLKTVKEGGAHTELPTSPCILHHCQTLAVSCLRSSSRLATLIVNKHCHHFHYCQSHSFYTHFHCHERQKIHIILLSYYIPHHRANLHVHSLKKRKDTSSGQVCRNYHQYLISQNSHF